MPARRSNGEGSYFRKGDRYVYQAPTIPGTTKRPTVSATTRKELAEKRKELEARIAANAPLDGGATLNAFLDRYFADIKSDIDRGQGNIRDTTYHRNVVNLVSLRSLIGETKLSQLKLKQIEDAYRTLATTNTMTGRPHSPRTIDRTHAVLHTALKKAVQWEMIPRNPSDGAARPKPPTREIEYLTLDEVRGVLAIPDRLHALWHLLLFTGLRSGEARALKWDDYDGRVLTINGTLVYDHTNGGQRINPTKTKNGERKVTVDADLAASLNTHRTAQKREKLAAGSLWRDEGWIFTTTAGQPLWQKNLALAWETLVKQVTDKRVTPHGTRHTYVFLAMNYLGLSDQELVKQCGWSNPTILYANYEHFRAERSETAAERMGALLRGEA